MDCNVSPCGLIKREDMNQLTLDILSEANDLVAHRERFFVSLRMTKRC